MNVDRFVMMFAGIVILGGTGAAYFTGNLLFLGIPAFVGANLLQSSFTGFCPLAKIVKVIGMKPGNAFD